LFIQILTRRLEGTGSTLNPLFRIGFAGFDCVNAWFLRLEAKVAATIRRKIL